MRSALLTLLLLLTTSALVACVNDRDTAPGIEEPSPTLGEVKQAICSQACGGVNDIEDWSQCIDAACGFGSSSGWENYGSWAEGPNSSRYCTVYYRLAIDYCEPFDLDGGVQHKLGWDKYVVCSSGTSATQRRTVTYPGDNHCAGGEYDYGYHYPSFADF